MNFINHSPLFLVFQILNFPQVESVMEGYNGTIFAYGQTGSGKTHTMAGPRNAPPEMQGLLPRAFEHIFSNIAIADPSVTRFLVRASFLEIYNEEIRDLLSKDPKERCEYRSILLREMDRYSKLCHLFEYLVQLRSANQHGGS